MNAPRNASCIPTPHALQYVPKGTAMYNSPYYSGYSRSSSLSGEAMIILLIISLFVWIICIRYVYPAFIRDYLWDQGCEALKISWRFFGPGWFGDKCTLFFVRYADANRNIHEAYFKTGIFSGVYSTEDKIVSYASSKKSVPPIPKPNNPITREEISEIERIYGIKVGRPQNADTGKTTASDTKVHGGETARHDETVAIAAAPQAVSPASATPQQRDQSNATLIMENARLRNEVALLRKKVEELQKTADGG